MSASPQPIQSCPICDDGQLVHRVDEYIASLPGGEKLAVPGIAFAICDHCGERVISLNESRKIEKFVAEHMELLLPAELRSIREKLGVDQTEMAAALGLGAKTYHRWERGIQIPSRSMGYYLRMLNSHPEAFAWLRDRSWRHPENIVDVDFKQAFPAIRDHAAIYLTKKFNPARALCIGMPY